MKLFETAWMKNYIYYERYYDTELDKSIVKPITYTAEWFEEDSRGEYTSILDDSINLRKCQGNAKDGRNNWGFSDPIYRNIKEQYWNEVQIDTFNKKPRIWYIDIETRVGQSFKYENMLVKIRKKTSI